MLDDVVLPVSFAGAESSNFTMGHRVLAPGKHTVDTAANLLDVIRAAYVIPTQAEREHIIREGVAAIEAETGFTADLPAKTLLEVVNLSDARSRSSPPSTRSFCKCPRRSSSTPCSCISVTSRSTMLRQADQQVHHRLQRQPRMRRHHHRR